MILKGWVPSSLLAWKPSKQCNLGSALVFDPPGDKAGGSCVQSRISMCIEVQATGSYLMVCLGPMLPVGGFFI